MFKLLAPDRRVDGFSEQMIHALTSRARNFSSIYGAWVDDLPEDLFANPRFRGVEKSFLEWDPNSIPVYWRKVYISTGRQGVGRLEESMKSSIGVWAPHLNKIVLALMTLESTATNQAIADCFGNILLERSDLRSSLEPGLLIDLSRYSQKIAQYIGELGDQRQRALLGLASQEQFEFALGLIRDKAGAIKELITNDRSEIALKWLSKNSAQNHAVFTSSDLESIKQTAMHTLAGELRPEAIRTDLANSIDSIDQTLLQRNKYHIAVAVQLVAFLFFNGKENPWTYLFLTATATRYLAVEHRISQSDALLYSGLTWIIANLFLSRFS